MDGRTAPAHELVELVRRLRLAVDERDGRWTASGAIDGVRISVLLFPTVIVEARQSIPGKVSIVPVSPAEREDADGLSIGDPSFDDSMRVTGRPAWAFAVLDPGTRNTLRERIERRGVRVRDGAVVWTADAPSADALQKAVADVVNVAKLLSLETSREEAQLAANLGAETHETVRVHIAQCLGGFPDAPIAAAALERALEDRSPLVRLAAARASSRKPATEALAALARDRALPEPIRIDAFEAFTARADSPAILALAVEVLRASEPKLFLLALRAAGDQPIAQESLLPFASDASPEIRLEVAKRLDASTPDAERALVGRLGDEVPEIVLAVLAALGRGAGVSAIEALQPLTEGFFNRDRRTAAEAAIEAIQLRAKSAPGGLTLAEADDARGRLSPSQQEAGAVSLADRKKS